MHNPVRLTINSKTNVKSNLGLYVLLDLKLLAGATRDPKEILLINYLGKGRTMNSECHIRLGERLIN